nr:MAG TPA: hypothetical protein [Caudoviricetes sp.]
MFKAWFNSHSLHHIREGASPVETAVRIRIPMTERV